jgi:dihydrofolate synthase/folylpolyglutamate synthase
MARKMTKESNGYEAIVSWMFRQIPMYQRTGKAAYKIDLEKTERIDQYFKEPHKSYKTIHVAGTNGKGSVSHILASVLQEAGYKVGLYTSPHLKDFRERIRVNGKMIQKADVVYFVKENQTFFEEIQPSFFEMSVAMAFDYFEKQEVDVAIVEVGMGGRLDSTNIVYPEISIITNIGLDHTAFLGNTLPLIAEEKAGVIKEGVPVVIGETHPQTKPVFRKKAKQVKTQLYFADNAYKLEPFEVFNPLKNAFKVYDAVEGRYLFELTTDLLGAYQKKNLATVLKSLDLLLNYFLFDEDAINRGLSNVKQNTGFLGRWQVLDTSPLVICDTAHNAEGIALNVEQIGKMNYPKLHFVLGFVNDKNLESVLSLFPKEATYYFTRADIPRALDEKELEKQASKAGLEGNAYSSIEKALNEAKKKAKQEDLIYIGGSTFVVSEIL